MTSRLKRKLNDLGVDTSSSKASENFCLIGTPLPPLEKSKDTGEFVPLWKQDVRDEKGRRRLHGAFTGGWSAGYYNSVGSKEGWTPSTFVSSRSERAKKQAARPEDFMDEEDLAELQEGRKLVDENEEMDFGGTEAEMRRRTGGDAEDDPMASALASALAPAPQDSVGARILRKMGWRVGQGVGPRLTWEQRRAQDRIATRQAPRGEGDAEDEEAKKLMYPRRDTPLLVVPRKDNAHGLGYVPGLGLNASVGAEGSSTQKGPQLAAGFGLGALNDADDDDVDVYDTSMRPRAGGRVAYEVMEEDEQISMGSSRQNRRDLGSRTVQPAQKTQTFRDGRPVLKGFSLSDKPVSEDRWFPLPDVPAGWKPNPQRVWDAAENKENATPAKEPHEPPRTHAEWKASLLSADERGTLLGETPLPSQPRSVFDFFSQKDKERLEKVRDTLQARAAGFAPEQSEQPVAPVHIPGEVVIPDLHPSVAKAALSGFQPFTADPLKQARYTTFLTFASSAAPDKKLGMGPTPGQSVDEFNKELSDYAKSAVVFKPLSGAMASRFQSAAVIELGPDVVEGLHTPDLSTPLEPEQAEKEEKKDGDPRMAAVRMGMYGPLTHEVTPWQPARLLCKRFSVREPEVEASEMDAPASNARAQDTSVAQAAAPAAAPLAITDGSAVATDTESSEQQHKGPRNLANVGLGEDDDQGRDTLTYQRPAMDVFKAIFASDDEESDDEDEQSTPQGASTTLQAPLKVTQSREASAHPDAGPSTIVSHPPSRESIPPNTADETVDLATFKPTFVPRAERESRKAKSKDNDLDRGKHRDKERKKKHAKTLVSFDTEDGDEGLQVVPKREKHKHKDGERKKKKKVEKKGEDDDDNMWVEAPAPEAVQHLDLKAVPAQPGDEPSSETPAGPPRGRKRAIDFM